MNDGTIIRTVLRIAVSLNTAVYAVTAAVNGLDNTKLTIVWSVITILSDFIVSFVTTYYNNDYTVEACIGTGITRQLKMEASGDSTGEDFFSDEEREDFYEESDI